jgi:hypothetical protein
LRADARDRVGVTMAESVVKPEHETAALEQRRQHRQLILRTGKIESAGARHEIDCAILDISVTGARLLLPAGTAVPDIFKLTTSPGEERFLCRVAWKRGHRVGVMFEKTWATP